MSAATIRCASPTCAVTESTPGVFTPARLRRLGWALERQEGDDRPRWYCRRCKL